MRAILAFLMRVPAWLQTPRRLTLLFLAVGFVSTVALGGLTLELLSQEQTAAQQRQRERLEQAADASVVSAARRLHELEHTLEASDTQSPALPPDTVIVAWNDARITVAPAGGILYRPVVPTAAPPPARTFIEAERLELTQGELVAATRAYAALTATTRERAGQAAAWTRLARVYKKLGTSQAALDAYERLAMFGDLIVDGLPAELIARVGRASVFESTGDTRNVRAEAQRLQADLKSGVLPLTRAQHAYYAAEASRWLGTSIVFDADAMARTEAVERMWTRRDAVAPRGHQVVVVPSGAALVSWNVQGDGRGTALIVGPRALNALLAQTVPPGISWALTDSDGHLVAGQAPPPRAASRTPAVTDLPWTLHVFSAPGNTPVEASARRTLLVVIAIVGALLMAGWYSIWRGISRELRVGRLQADFVAAVSHEFRSPLTSLRQIAELLQSKRFTSEDQKRRSYDLLASEADRLGRLVEGLLDFARFEERGMEMRPTNLSLDELVGAVVSAFQGRSDVGGRTLTFCSSEPGIVVKADRDGLTRAIWNVVDNAVKYSPVGGTIRVSVDRGHSGTARVSVSDEGLGIPADEQRAIFERFVRGSEAKSRRIQGTGIGLALVQTILRAHGGDIAVESAPGAGSTFTLTLPAESPIVNRSAVGFVDAVGDHQVTR